MFDFFKDTYYDLKGIDRKKAELEKLQNSKAKEKIILSKSAKAVICIISILLLLASAVTAFVYFTNNNNVQAIRYAIEIPILISIIILIFIRKKKTELVGTVMFILFMIYRYIALRIA